MRQAELAGAGRTLREALPLVALALPWVGHFQTRNRGTVCGSIAHADPSAELPLVLVALGGEVLLRSASGVAASPPGLLPRHDADGARADDELIEGDSRCPAAGIALRLPRGRAPPRRLRHRRLRGGETPTGVRLAVGGVADVPTARDWPRLDGSALDDALNAFAYELGARDDVHATARYRRDLVRMIGRDLIEEVRQ